MNQNRIKVSWAANVMRSIWNWRKGNHDWMGKNMHSPKPSTEESNMTNIRVAHMHDDNIWSEYMAYFQWLSIKKGSLCLHVCLRSPIQPWPVRNKLVSLEILSASNNKPIFSLKRLWNQYLLWSVSCRCPLPTLQLIINAFVDRRTDGQIVLLSRVAVSAGDHDDVVRCCVVCTPCLAELF